MSLEAAAKLLGLASIEAEGSAYLIGRVGVFDKCTYWSADDLCGALLDKLAERGMYPDLSCNHKSGKKWDATAHRNLLDPEDEPITFTGPTRLQAVLALVGNMTAGARYTARQQT